MDNYNADTTDLFLFALGNFFGINIVILKSVKENVGLRILKKMMAALEKLYILLRPGPSILIL